MHTVVIQRIESVGPQRRARRIFFDDGSPPRTTSAAAFKLLGVDTGSPVDPNELSETLSESEPRLARERALKLLGYRERSRSELHQRLMESGYPREVVDDIVERYCEVELVDDARFAAAWVRSRAGRGYGRQRIARELADKGVSPHVVEAVIASELVGDDVSHAREALRGKIPRDAKERERLVRRLVSRGFDLRTAVDAVGRVEGPTSSSH